MRLFSTVTQSFHGDVIESGHCSVMGLNSLKKRDGRWLKLLISKGKFTFQNNQCNSVAYCISAIGSDDDDDDNAAAVYSVHSFVNIASQNFCLHAPPQ